MTFGVLGTIVTDIIVLVALGSFTWTVFLPPLPNKGREACEARKVLGGLEERGQSCGGGDRAATPELAVPFDIFALGLSSRQLVF